MKISTITIEGMHNVTYSSLTFNDGTLLTYLYGINGAGKSTIMQAIQLALLGYIPGTDKNKSAIFRHANDKVMSVVLTFDDGSSITRKWENTGKDIKATVVLEPSYLDIQSIIAELELPIFNFNEFAGMTANKLKDWFINFLPDDEIGVDWNYELNNALPQLSQDVSTILAATIDMINGFEGSVLDKTRKFNEYCKVELSNCKTDITRLEGTIKSLIFYDDFDTTMNEDMISAEIKAKDIQLQTIRHKQSTYYNQVDMTNQYQQLLAKYNVDTLDALQTYELSIKEKISDLIKKEAESSAKCRDLQMIYAELEAKVKAADGLNSICPYTKTECDTMQTYKAEAVKSAETAKAEYKNIGVLLGTARGEHEAILKEYNMLMQTGSSLASDIQLAAQLSQYVITEDIVTLTQEEQQIASDLDTLRTNLEKIKANKQYEQLKATISADLYSAQERLEIFKAWDKLSGVNALQSNIMLAPFEKFSNIISKYLVSFFDDTAVAAAFHVGEKANSFSFGMVRNGKYLDYDLLSSGEKCLYALSLLMAIIDTSNTNLKIIMVDDLLDHLDKDKILSCFTTLYNSKSIQTIIAGVQKCEHPDADKFVVNIRG